MPAELGSGEKKFINADDWTRRRHVSHENEEETGWSSVLGLWAEEEVVP